MVSSQGQMTRFHDSNYIVMPQDNTCMLIGQPVPSFSFSPFTDIELLMFVNSSLFEYGIAQ